MPHHRLWSGLVAGLILGAPAADAQMLAPSTDLCVGCSDLGMPVAPVALDATPHRARRAAGWGQVDLFPRAASARVYDLRRGHALVAGDDHGWLTLHAVRNFARKRSPAEASLGRRDKVSASIVGLRYDVQADGGDHFALLADGGIARRRFASSIAGANWSTSRSMRIGGEWIRGDVWRASAAYALTAGDQRRLGIRRGVELAQGGLASRAGMRLGLDYSPAGFAARPPFSLGLAAGLDRLSHADRLALGAASPADRRLTANIAWKF